jgi:hypothetical protein
VCVCVCVCVLTFSLAAHWAPSGPVAWSQGRVQLSGNILFVCLCVCPSLSMSLLLCLCLSVAVSLSLRERPCHCLRFSSPARPCACTRGPLSARRCPHRERQGPRQTYCSRPANRPAAHRAVRVNTACMHGCRGMWDSPFCGAPRTLMPAQQPNPPMRGMCAGPREEWENLLTNGLRRGS